MPEGRTFRNQFLKVAMLLGVAQNTVSTWFQKRNISNITRDNSNEAECDFSEWTVRRFILLSERLPLLLESKRADMTDLTLTREPHARGPDGCAILRTLIYPVTPARPRA